MSAAISRSNLSIESASGVAGLLRFTTAGSVDDGKSTMIGRLLYDAKSVYEDQLRSIEKSGINRADGPIDFSLLTDGLRAEREQGITIDVAYRYFSTAKRKFIIADTPGHEQYTRNMVTGASTADAAIILIDARKGLLTQSRRHTYIASLLGIQHVIAAVNKMDLVEYHEDIFKTISDQFTAFAGRLRIPNVYAIPVSALRGDGIVHRGNKMEWFDGPTLLQLLEALPNRSQESTGALRLPIQYVIRPHSDFRGFAGQVASGRLKKGEKVVVLPSFTKTRVKSIVTFEGEIEEAGVNRSIAFTLEDEIDVGRGDLLASEEDHPQSATQLLAHLVWMHADPSQQHEYLLKHTTRVVRARLKDILHCVDMNTLEHASSCSLKMNDIAAVRIETTKPLLFDAYQQNRTTGSFILIDPITNATVAAGMIEGPWHDEVQIGETGKDSQSPVVNEEQPPVKGTNKTEFAAAIWLVGHISLAQEMEHAILENGWKAQLISGDEFNSIELTAIAKILQRRGVTAILSLSNEDIALKASITAIFEEQCFLDLTQTSLDQQASVLVLAWLRDLRTKVKRG